MDTGRWAIAMYSQRPAAPFLRDCEIVKGAPGSSLPSNRPDLTIHRPCLVAQGFSIERSLHYQIPILNSVALGTGDAGRWDGNSALRRAIGDLGVIPCRL
jgi:hypothetical protein